MPPKDSITSISKLVEIINHWENRFHDPGLGTIPIWYRGHADISWDLQPTVLRPWFIKRIDQFTEFSDLDNHTKIFAMEWKINQEFLRTAISFFPDNIDLTQKYFLSQHHGMPTRLLDWSSNALVGLFNAVCERPNEDGGIYVLKPTDLIHKPHETVSFPKAIASMDDKWVKATIKHLYGKTLQEGNQEELKIINNPIIIPVSPDLSLGRMFQQNAQFTLHMPSKEPLQIPKSAVELYSIPAKSKKDILLELRRLGTNWATLFPDLDHIAKEIRTSWLLYE